MNNHDPYYDENHHALKNKLNIIDHSKLDKVEAALAMVAIIEIRKNPFEITSVFDILKIHKMLFGELYEWAGTIRTITMYKREPILGGASVDYTPSQYIEPELEELDKEFRNIDWKSLNKHQKVKKVAHIVQQLWQIHSFREGNSRSSTMFMYLLLKQLGFSINIDFISKYNKYLRNAFVLASIYSLSKPEFLEGMIKDSVTVKNIDTKKYETIDGYEVDKYQYSYHTIEKLRVLTPEEVLKQIR